jgi:uncharacterized delta-60 repeat protein
MARTGRFHNSLIAVLAAALFAVAIIRPAFAAPGDVDPTFGFAGRVLNSFQQPSAEILALAVQPDGKIVAVGNIHETITTGPSRFLVARHNTNGSLDTSFGNGGKVVTNFSVGPSSANAVVLQADGKIVVAGKAGDMFALARYNSDGTLDQSFGSAGLLATRFEPNDPNTLSLAASVAIQSDGKIVVAGDSFVRNPSFPTFVTDSNVGVARFNAEGTIDETFGTGGVVISNFISFDRADALAIQPDGKIIVAGDSNSTGTGPYTAYLFRYNSNGTPDETFGSSGLGAAITGSFDVAAVSLQPDGKIVVGGTFLSASPANADFALARYHSDGTLDNGFGVAGVAVTDFPWTGNASGRENVAATLALQQDGKIVVGGYSTSTFALARYNTDGSADAGFGSGGIAITQVSSLGSTTFNFPIAASSTFSAGLVIFIDGHGPGFNDCWLLIPNPCGVSLSLFLVEQTFALAIQPTGKIIAGGVLDKQAALVRYHSITTPKITVANTGPGLGGIWSPDGAISCGTRCSASYDGGSTVLLGWATALGSYFAGWTGCTPIPGGGCTLTLNVDTMVTAEFDLDLPIAADAADLPNGAVGLDYTVQVGLPGKAPFNSRIVSGSLPPGLVLNSRMLSGTPTRPGKSKFTIEFTDATGLSTKKDFKLTVLKSLNLATQSLKAAHLGRSYNAALKAKGGAGPYAWSQVSGNLPAGVSFDSSTARISGVPTVAGTYNFTIRVADALGQQVERTFNLIAN